MKTADLIGWLLCAIILTGVVVIDLHRAGDPYKTRHCSSLDNAVISATKLAQEHGMLRDVVEVSHKITGKQLATVKVTLKGLSINRVWEREI